MFNIEKTLVPTIEQIEKLQSEMVKMPQVELETEHYFSGGMYCRKLIRPAGTLIVGKVHKKDHFLDRCILMNRKFHLYFV